MFLRRSVIILFLVALLALVYFIGVSYHNYRSYNKTYSLINHTHLVIQQIQKAADQRLALRSYLEGYIITGNKDYIRSFLTTSSDLKTTLANIRFLTKDNPVQQANADSISSLVNAAVYFITQTIINSGPSQKPSFNFLKNENAKNLFNTINSINDRMQIEENRLLIDRNKTYEAKSKKSFYITLFGGIFAFLFLLYAFWQLNRDFFKRKKTEAALIASEIKYRKLIEEARVVVFTSDLNGKFTFVSSRVLELTGYTPEELLHKSYTFLVDNSWIEKIQQHYTRQLQQNIPESTLVFPVCTKNGQLKWVRQFATILFDDEKPAGLQCVVMDVSERRDMLKRLRDSEQQRKENANLLQAIMDNSAALIFIKDLEHRYLFANKKFRETVGMSEEELYGKTDYDFTPPEMAEKYHYYDDDILRGNSNVEAEETILINGEPYNYLTTKFPLYNAANKMFAICGVATDITERTRQQEELIAARKKAEAAEKQQEQFLATMSHEIRTPINGIIGMAHLLSSTTLNKEQQEFLQAIFESSDTLLMLVNDILDFSKINAGMLNLEKTPFSLSDTLQAIQHAFGYRMNEKKLSFAIQIDADVPDGLQGDPYRLKQILINLVGNALKFTEKGFVNIQVQPDQQQGDKTCLRFMVSDSGIGIAADKLETIFDSFTQAGSDISRKFGGSGLGLSITKKLIELQGGKIAVSSRLHQGSVFTFILPYYVMKKQAGALSAARMNNDEFLQQLHILIAEDNLINQKVLQYSLKKAGVHIVMTGNGKEAIAYIRQRQDFDLILLDIQMPEMNGYEVAKYIRDVLGLHTPIIAMTATAMKGEKEKCLQAGMNGYISKPFSPTELFDQINVALKKVPIMSPTASSPEEKLYDLSYLLQLEDDSYLLEILELFLHTTPENVQAIQENITAKNWEKVYELAHRMKSGLGMMQMQSFLQVVTNIETSAKERTSLDKMSEWISTASAFMNKIKPLLEAEKEKIKNRLAST